MSDVMSDEKENENKWIRAIFLKKIFFKRRVYGLKKLGKKRSKKAGDTGRQGRSGQSRWNNHENYSSAARRGAAHWCYW
jgi:hypothetical protein